MDLVANHQLIRFRDIARSMADFDNERFGTKVVTVLEFVDGITVQVRSEVDDNQIISAYYDAVAKAFADASHHVLVDRFTMGNVIDKAFTWVSLREERCVE